MNKADALRARLDLIRCYQRLFLNDGQLTNDARAFFADLSAVCKVRESAPIKSQSGEIDPVAHVLRDGKRSVYEHIQNRLTEDPVTLQDKLAKEEF